VHIYWFNLGHCTSGLCSRGRCNCDVCSEGHTIRLAYVAYYTRYAFTGKLLLLNTSNVGPAVNITALLNVPV